MGILNVTPDSFSDGGCFTDIEKAVTHAAEMISQGADIIDIGGESTRPGSEGVSVEEERERVVPVVERLSRSMPQTLISVDTTKPEVAEEAVAAGAGMINDVSALRDGPALASIAAGAGAQLVIMHSRRTPLDMQRHTEYGDLISEVEDHLLERAAVAEEAGVPKKSIWLDPGIGFAKTAEGSLLVLKEMARFVRHGYPVLSGPSRKSFIHHVTGAPVEERIGGTAAAVTASVLAGVAAVRVHDVAVMRQVVDVADAIARSKSGADA